VATSLWHIISVTAESPAAKSSDHVRYRAAPATIARRCVVAQSLPAWVLILDGFGTILKRDTNDPIDLIPLFFCSELNASVPFSQAS